jgi:hypothetical protein
VVDEAHGTGSGEPAADAARVEAAVAELAKALGDVHDTIPRCASCWNFLAVVARARRELEALTAGPAGVAPSAGAARERFDAWLAEAEGRVKTTNHCEICVPAGPFERFLQALGRSS